MKRPRRTPPWRDLLVRRAPRLFLRFATPDREELGRLGEELAARALAARGWRIVGRRLQTPWAEIDVVAVEADELVCVEVKAGRLRGEGLRHRPGLRVDRERLARLAGAGRWLARRGLGAVDGVRRCGGRVDLLEVILRGSPPRLEIQHHPRLLTPLPEVAPPPARFAATGSPTGRSRGHADPGPPGSRS